jgi:hypothetical protein
MTGSLPQALGGLKQLDHLDLSNNRLDGPLPETLGGLELLTALDLGGNQLEGSIPAALADLGQLTRLGLAGNRLEGSIPARLAGLVHLTVLALDRNRLTGVVPGLPFKQYTSYCALQAPTSPSNSFTCPLPPVRQRRRAHVAAARAAPHVAHTVCHPSISMPSLTQQARPRCHSPPRAHALTVAGLRQVHT